jgi:hypothetical protein
MIEDNEGNRTGFFTIDPKNTDALLMVYSLSQSSGSHPFRIISEKDFSKKVRLPMYVQKNTILTSTAYAEYYFRRRVIDLSQFADVPGSFQVISPDISKDFWVRRVEEPDKFTKVTADLKFNGQRCLIYRDKSISDDFISSEQIDQIGSKFDNEIYQTNQAYFGTESDINGDSKITILITGIISSHAAFFDQKDLFPEVPYSNRQEIIFLRVTPHRAPIDFFTSTLAHEFQHLISMNQRVFLRHSYPEERWLDEGLSYMAEYLSGSQGNITHAYSFLSTPHNYSLLHFTKPYGENQGTLGAIYLFMRYLVDRYGESILSKLAQTESRGIANVEAATGTDFQTLYRDWIAAMFLSDTGLNPDPIFNYKSLQLRGLQSPIQVFRIPIRYFLNGPAEQVLELRKDGLEKGSFGSSVEAMGVQYLRVRGSNTPVSLKLVGTQASKLEAALIYLPKDYRPTPHAPVHIIEGITLDTPLPLLYSIRKKAALTGKVLNPGIKKVGIRFEPQASTPSSGRITVWSPVDFDGSFKFNFKFRDKGDFLMGVGLFADQQEATIKENIWVRVE